MAIKRLVRSKSSLASFIVAGDKEKKATSAPEINAEPNNNVKTKTIRTSISMSRPLELSKNTLGNTLKKTSFN